MLSFVGVSSNRPSLLRIRPTVLLELLILAQGSNASTPSNPNSGQMPRVNGLETTQLFPHPLPPTIQSVAKILTGTTMLHINSARSNSQQVRVQLQWAKEAPSPPSMASRNIISTTINIKRTICNASRRSLAYNMPSNRINIWLPTLQLPARHQRLELLTTSIPNSMRSCSSTSGGQTVVLSPPQDGARALHRLLLLLLIVLEQAVAALHFQLTCKANKG